MNTGRGCFLTVYLARFPWLSDWWVDLGLYWDFQVSFLDTSFFFFFLTEEQMQWATKLLGICVYTCVTIPGKPEGWGMTEQRRKESRQGGPSLARKAGLTVWSCALSPGRLWGVLLLRSLLQEGGGEIHPSVRSPVISIPFTRIKPPHFWVLPPAPEAPGVGTSPGPLLLATPSLGSLISLKEPVFFLPNFLFCDRI